MLKLIANIAQEAFTAFRFAGIAEPAAEEDQADDHEAERLPLGEAGVAPPAEDTPAEAPEEAPAPETADEPVETGETETPDNAAGADHLDRHDTGTPVSQLRKRLALIMPSEARK